MTKADIVARVAQRIGMTDLVNDLSTLYSGIHKMDKVELNRDFVLNT